MSQQMVEDAKLRLVEKMLWHLGQIEKTYKVDKQKNARDLLLHQSLQGDSQCMQQVHSFRDDPNVFETYCTEATNLVKGDIARPRYNLCLGLLAA